MVREVLPEREAGFLVGSRPWPLLAARMHQLGEHGGAADTCSTARHPSFPSVAFLSRTERAIPP